jgi:cytochrome b561
MDWKDDREDFGRTSIILHWTSAVLVLALLVLGFWAFLLDRGPDRSALLNIHVSLGLTLIPIHIVRVVWRWRYGKPVTVHQSRAIQVLAETVWRVLLVLIAVQLLTGPLLVWLHGRDLGSYGLFEIASPIARNEQLHAHLVRPLHLITGVQLSLNILLHLAGVLKHVLIDRDDVVARMLGTRRRPRKPAE